jgi:transposase
MATRDEWADRVGRWQRSGLSAKAFAGRERLNPKLLTWWRWKLRTSATSPPEPAQFLPVRVVDSVSPSANSAVAVEIALANGRIVRVAPGFDATTLARVLALASTQPEDEPC